MRRLLTALSVVLLGVGLFAARASADDMSTCHDRVIPPDEAIAACNRVLAASAGTSVSVAWTLVGRANALIAKREFDRALADFDLAIARNPRLAAAYAGRAHARHAKGDLDGAIADYDAALGINPRAVMFLIDRGNAWRAKKDVDRAIADYSEAIRIDPTLPGSFISRGLARESKGEREAARADYEAVLALPPKGDPARRIQDTARARIASLGPAEHTPPPVTRAPTQGLALPQPTPMAKPASVTTVTPVAAPAAPAPVIAAPPAKSAKPATPPSAPVVATATAPAAAPPAQPQAPSLPAIPAADAGGRLALVIGNGGYVNATALPNPPNDARLVGKTLRAMGFEVLEGTDLDRNGMERLIREFLHKAPNHRVTLLFYAGHGMQVDGRNYLVPIDAKLSAPSDLGFETIELDKVLAGLDDQARASIVILDACRDNPLARSFATRLGATRSASVPGGLAGYATVGTGTLIAFATAPGQTALDGRDANSPFTSALIKHLRTPGMEVNQMLTRVRVEVASITGNKQIPWANSSLLGDVYLAGK